MLNVNLMQNYPHRNIQNNDQISEHLGPARLTRKSNYHKWNIYSTNVAKWVVWHNSWNNWE